MSMRSLVAFVSFAFLLAPASGSTLEDATGGFVAYQFDGDGHHDAPDTCSDASMEWSGRLGSQTDGTLLAPDDVSDVFMVDVPADLRGQRLQVTLAETADLDSLELTAYLPGCGGTVLDLVNWPTPEPAPPAPAAGQRQASAEVAAPAWFCDPGQRVFWAETMPEHPPAPTIHVAWTDGSERTVALSSTHGAAHAFYVTDHALGTTLKGAWMNMPEGWAGQFVYAIGPCDAVDGGAVYGEPPVSSLGSLAFTPTRAGPYAVQVTYRGAAGDLLVPLPAPVSVPLGTLVPVDGDDLPHDPTGTLKGFGHDHGSADHSSADHTHGLGGIVVPKVPAAPDLQAASPDPLAPSSTAGAIPLPETGGLTQPIVVPMTCHTCVHDAEDVVKRIAYSLTFLAS